ncbi:acyl-CoA dehydrogenase, partial [Parasphingorhabdus sp.]
IGGDAILLESLMEEAGKHLLCSPFISTSVWAARLLSDVSDAALKEELLGAICSGDKIFAVVATGERGLWTADDIAVSASKNGEDWTLSGTASYIVHAAGADTLLVFARTDSGLAAFLVDPSQSALTISRLKANDPTLRLSKIDFSDVSARHLPGIDAQSYSTALDLARVALAGEHAGGVKRIFEITMDYLRTRHQFGRQIGSYQSLKHMAADMLVEVESATSAAQHAARAIATEAEDAQALINLAGFACADAYRDVSAEAIQMHGGIAYTWEHPAHLYWRRARTGLWLFGSSDHHREQYLAQLEAA